MVLTGAALLLSCVIAALCVGMQYEVMRLLGRWMGRARPRRQGVIVVVIGLLAAHVVQIWLFAGLFTLLAQWPEMGSIRGDGTLAFMDFVYYSSIVFTTVGFGDMVPSGELRIITGTEALLGFGLLTWSASFTFLEMQRFWPAGD